ncbi:MAG: hypothetical protein IKK57_01055 [Clostridia bacterium]|nr:hypothetical protein [Clostridia bacterium]
MLKKLLLLLLALLLCSAAAEAPVTFVITDEMQFYSAPGREALQSAFHNTPPQPGETAEIIGRVAGTDGEDWLLVCFTGHWFSRSMPVWYYLPASAVPEAADVPVLDLLAEKNALAAEYVTVYADPQGLNHDGYLLPDDAGVTVLALHGDFVYIEAVNPYGYLRRGFIAAADLVSPPGASALEKAADTVAVRTEALSIPLIHAPANGDFEALPLAGGTLVLRYGSVPADAPWAVTLAVIAPDGTLTANLIHRTHDGAEESTVEYLLASPLGFRVCRFTGEEAASVREEHYSLTGEAVRTDVRRYAGGEVRPVRDTAGFSVSFGGGVDAVTQGLQSVPLRITAAGGAAIQMNVSADAYIHGVTECDGMLLLPVCTGGNTRLLLISGEAAVLADIAVPMDIYDLQAAAAEDGVLALMTTDGLGTWQSWTLDVTSGMLTAGDSMTIPANRQVALLAADAGRLLLAVSGTQTQLLLVEDGRQLLAAETPGSLVHAASDGETAALLLMENGLLRLERWSLQIP